MTKRIHWSDLPVHRERVSNFSHDGRGVVHVEGKVVFIDGALPKELIRFQITGKRRKVYQGRLLDVLEPSVERVQPRCNVFGVCGGCALQHMTDSAQQAFKQDLLLQNLQRFGGLSPEVVLPVIRDQAWNYRRKARLGVRLVPKKGGILLGFRERRTSFITNLDCCPILDHRLSKLLQPLQQLLQSISIKGAIPQIEVAATADNIALVFRHIQPFSAQDRLALQGFAKTEEIQVLLQSAGPDSIQALWPTAGSTLSYSLDGFDLDLAFSALDFIQVNAVMNQKLVRRTVALLDSNNDQTILELFCGLGNFSLAVAKSGGLVTGIEGAADLVFQAQENARNNGLDNTARFYQADLFEQPLSEAVWLNQVYDRVLLDPPRTGALQVVTEMSRWQPEKIVYISCNPATLARDADILVHRHGYRLQAAGIADMFPHTAHVEAIAVFEH